MVISDIQSHISTFSPSPQETAMVLQRMIMDTVAMVAEACKTFHRHSSGCCRVVTLSGYHTRKDQTVGHKRIETLDVVQEALEMMQHPHPTNRSLGHLLAGDMKKLFPISAEEPGAPLKWSLRKELCAALALASPED